MRINIFTLMGIILLTGCGSSSSQSRADSIGISRPDSISSTSNNDKYVCGFTASFEYFDNNPISATLITYNDSIIERTFSNIWRNVIGGRLDAIKIEKDANQNNAEYRYAAAKGSYTDLGNIIRHVFYKTDELSPFLRTYNGWIMKAIALHELGHHINCDPFTGVSREEAELGADDYAGFMMGGSKLKTTLDTALLAFSTLTEVHPTNGYPDRQKRIEAVKAGWKRAQTTYSYSIVSTFAAVIGERHGVFFNDRDFDFRDIQKAVKFNGELKSSKDTSTINMAKVNIEASMSPGEFFLDKNYLYFKKADSLSVVGRVANSNRPEYRLMVYDKFYQYMYIDKNNQLLTYSTGFRSSTPTSTPTFVGSLTEQRHR